MSDNPFKPVAATAATETPTAPTAPPADAAAVDAVLAAMAPTDDAAPESVDEGTEYGSFKPAAPAKPVLVPLKRLNKVIGERNELRASDRAKEVALAEANARLDGYKRLDSVVAEKYAKDPGLLKFDAEFMEAFERLAPNDPAIKAAAAKIKAAMNGAPVNDPAAKPAAIETPAPTEKGADPALTAIVHRDATRTILEALSAHDVKPHFAQMVARDVIANVEFGDLASITPEQAVEAAKLYFKDMGVTHEEFLGAGAKGAKPKPATGGRSRPAAAPDAGDADASAADGGEAKPKFKSLEEYEAHRNKRFNQIVREAGF